MFKISAALKLAVAQVHASLSTATAGGGGLDTVVVAAARPAVVGGRGI